MLYDGLKVERSGYVRVPASPASARRVHAALPQHHGVALDVDAAPPGPAGQLGVLAGGDVGVLLAVPLDELLQHHRAGGHVDAQRQGLGGEDGLDQAAYEQLLDDLLEGRQHARVVRGDAPLQALQPLVVAEDMQVLVGDGGGALLDDARGPAARASSSLSRSPAYRHCWTAASQPARLKMKVMAGSSPSASSRSMTSGRLGRPDPAALAALALAVGLAHGRAAAAVARR